MPIDWKTQIAKAKNFVEQRGWKVVFKRRAKDLSDPDTNTITINSSHPIRRRFYIMIHEIGHMMLFDTYDYELKYERWKGRGKYSTLKYRIGIVEEEIDAWNEGEYVARSNGWEFDSHYDVVRANMLSTYFLWSMSIKHPHPHYSGRRLPTIKKDTNDNIPVVPNNKEA